ncbi:branched-chain alpha-ketoacid dehydrogenase [Fimicolochytrium jonesii]|uniref:branched-chain alpha-ketoacid dehydrogenase n=1 Tax=Fimicolochytrium jonesii TaxID=1396493 RepID=UPI0022FE5737|nr:branched-chain alpha-ketoacid dehydrogenase [Fimicolochytrium jonesii]KAI8823606.1 branched-chain alpha-ketoacid dehydrogenase [Fimicolochytrium jonesii]
MFVRRRLQSQLGRRGNTAFETCTAVRSSESISRRLPACAAVRATAARNLSSTPARRSVTVPPVPEPVLPPTSASPVWTSSSLVEKYARMPITPVTLHELLQMGETHDLLSSAKFAHAELPKRMARRVKALQNLPFIVGVNPYIKSVYQLYQDSLEKLIALPAPVDPKSQQFFTEELRTLVTAHQEVIPKLAKGFKECIRYMTKESATSFLDNMIHARIGIRVIAEHHLSLDTPAPAYIGVVNTRLAPASLITSVANYSRELCEFNYGNAPEFTVNGHTDTLMAYIGVHLEYIFMELLKNAMRATVEYSQRTGRFEHPTVEISICQSKEAVIFRFRDQGGGISPKDWAHIWDYSYTTVPKYDDGDGIFNTQARMSMQTGVGGPMAGLGFGLPMSRIYAKYFQGSLDIKSVDGHGCDVFLMVPNIIGARHVIED